MSRMILNISLLASVLLVLSIFFLYRGKNWPLGVEGIEVVLALVLLFAINLALFLQQRRTAGINNYHPKSVTLGLFAGLLWTIEISINNILVPGLPTRDILDDLFWAAIALIIVIASIQYAYRTNQIFSGIKVGFWSGLSSGVVACVTGLLFVVFGMRFLLHDPLNSAEWTARGATSGTPNMAVYFAYQTLAGALLHVVVLGVSMGIVLGVVGGVIAKVGYFIVIRSIKHEYL